MTALRNAPVELTEEEYDSVTGRGDPQQRYRVYRLCSCERCEGLGKVERVAGAKGMQTGLPRCPDCRGEGRVRELVATAGTPEGVGQLIVQNGLEGAFLECPMGLLDTEGKVGQKWLISPWLPSARNISDAGRTLAQARHTKGER